jgi:tetratricopeptide (TPR) repeat protein
MKPFAFFLAAFLFSLCAEPVAATAPTQVSSEEARAWQEDLAALAIELPRRHKNAFARMTGKEFDAAVRRLDANIPGMSREEIVVEFARIVAMVRDAHTGIRGLLYGRLSYLPAALYLFKDGLYVYSAEPRLADAVGGKVIRIGRASTEEALKAVAPLIPADNEMALKERAPLYLTSPEILYALNLIDDVSRVPFVVEKGARKTRVVLSPLPAPRPNDDNWALGQRFSKLPTWIDARPKSVPVPLWLHEPTNYFWHRFLPDSGTLYAQFNDVANKEKETVKSWVDQLQPMLDEPAIRRFILDLRWNTGGNNYLNKPLLLALIKSRKVNQRGKLFVIIGRRNFSAAQNLINDLSNYTEAIFVGEPTASPPNFFGDSTGIELPNSKMVVGASTLWWQDADPRDRRKWTAPDLAAELSFDDYRKGRDPALDLILQHKPERPLAEHMYDELINRRQDVAMEAYRRFKSDPLHVYVDTQSTMNSLGYRLLNEGKIPEAISVFQLNVEAYPDSPNTHDSLADAYLAAGDKKAALESYRKELSLDPTNANAANAIRRLEEGD